MVTKAVFYHDNCIDGMMAAAIWHHHDSAGYFESVQYRRVPVLQDRYDEVVFLDFTPTIQWVNENMHHMGRLLIIDHHKTAEEDLVQIKNVFPDDCLTVHFDLERSGGTITWDVLHHNAPRPPLVQIAGDFDLGKPMGRFEGFVDMFAQYLEGDDDKRFPAFYDYVTEQDPDELEKRYALCDFVNVMREQKIRWFEQRLKYHKAKLSWLPGEPEITLAYTFCPHYLITSFGKYIVNTNPLVNAVVGVSLNDKSIGLSFRGRSGESYCREIAQRFGGGGHDSAAGAYINEAIGFHRLNELIQKGGNDQPWQKSSHT